MKRASTLDALTEKQAMRQGLESALVRSIALETFWPGAFDAGPCQPRLFTRCERTKTGGSKQRAFLELRRADGEAKVWPVEDVPRDILAPMARGCPFAGLIASQWEAGRKRGRIHGE